MESNMPHMLDDAGQQSNVFEDSQGSAATNLIISYPPSSMVQNEVIVAEQTGGYRNNVYHGFQGNMMEYYQASSTIEYVGIGAQQSEGYGSGGFDALQANVVDNSLQPTTVQQNFSYESQRNSSEGEKRAASFEFQTNLSVNCPPQSITQEMSTFGHQADAVGTQSNEIQRSNSNLIVNYVPQSMNQGEFRTLFASIGEMSECKLIKGRSPGSNLGYGFVKYNRDEDAEKAIKALNGLHILHKTIKVSKALPRTVNTQGSNLYISGLPKTMTKEDLKTLFSHYGVVISTKILYDRTSIRQYVGEAGQNLRGLSKGVGFVIFDQRTSAERAIKELNGSYLHGCTNPLVVNHAKNKDLPCVTENQSVSLGTASTSRFGLFPLAIDSLPDSMVPNSAPNDNGWCIFVYNLPYETEDVSLWQLFGPFGAIQKVHVKRHHATRGCIGYAFVTMTNYQEADAAIKHLNRCKFGDRILEVRFKTEKAPEEA